MAKKIFPVAKASKQPQKQPKRVLIGTPALDGRVDAWYSFAIHEITKLCQMRGIDIQMLLLSYESILPMARNELLTAAIKNDFDSLIFIDSDVFCNAQSFLDVITDARDVVAIPTVKKSDTESYDIFFADTPKQEGNWVKADRVSTSCLKLGRKALKALADNSTLTQFRGKQLFNICQYDFIGEEFMGEDIYLCEKLKQLGFDIWVNTTSTCMHIGPKVYSGDFKRILDNVNQTNGRG
jgi:hypothetical protein